MKKYKQINRQRKNRVLRVSNAVKRYSTRPRLCVFRSNTNIYAQIIDDMNSRTLVSASTRDKSLSQAIADNGTNTGNCAAAAVVGEEIAKRALEAGIRQVAFDRHGFKYHGRIQALADAARRAGLDIGSAGEQKISTKPKNDSSAKTKVSKADKIAAKAAAGKSASKKSNK